MGMVGRLKSYQQAALLWETRKRRLGDNGIKLDSPDRRLTKLGSGSFVVTIHGERVAILRPDNTMEFRAPGFYTSAFATNFGKLFPLTLWNVGRQRFNAIRDEDVGKVYRGDGSKKVGVLLIDGLRFDMSNWKPINPPVPEGRRANKDVEARFRKALTAYKRLWKVHARLGHVAAPLDVLRQLAGGRSNRLTELLAPYRPDKPAEFLHRVIVGQKVDRDTICGVASLVDVRWLWGMDGNNMSWTAKYRALSPNQRHGLIFERAYNYYRDEVRALAGVFVDG